jgi:5-methylcytosine-specific restriction endonuclease McrA
MMTPRQLLSHKLRDGRYRARSYHAPVDEGLTLEAAILAGLLSQDDCYYCGGKLTDYELDHKTPLQLGGAHKLSNIAKACPLCNHRKGTKSEGEFMRVRT